MVPRRITKTISTRRLGYRVYSEQICDRDVIAPPPSPAADVQYRGDAVRSRSEQITFLTHRLELALQLRHLEDRSALAVLVESGDDIFRRLDHRALADAA